MVAISKDPGVGVMARSKRVRIEDIVDYFDELEDPRTSINLKHPLVSVVVIAMMGVLAGDHGPTAIARWAKIKEEFLLQALPLPHGIPCKDVFRSVLSLLKPEAFQTCFAAWLLSLRDSAEDRIAEEGQALEQTVAACSDSGTHSSPGPAGE